MKMPDRIRDRIPAVYVCGVLALLSLVFHDGFFDINRVKFCFFTVWTVMFLILTYVSGGLKPSRKTLPVWIFCLICALSCLLSGHLLGTLTGKDGHLNGFLLVFLMSAGTLMAGRNQNRLWSVYALFISGCAVSLLGTLQFFRVDFLRFFDHMKPKQTEQFLSTLGNIDLVGAYLCLILPCAAVYGLHSDKPGALSAVTVFCVSLAVLPCRAESGMLALIASAFLCLKSGTKRGFFLTGLMCASLLIVCALMKCFPDRCFSLAGSSGWYVLKHWLSLAPAALVCFSAALLCGEKAAAFAGKAVKILFIAVCVCLAGAFVWFSFIDRETPLHAIWNYLRFSDTWGSYRGGVWKRCAKLYGDLPLYQKLLGLGPDNLTGPLYATYGSEISSFSGMRFDNAHCIPLQYLLTTGVLGFLSIGIAALLPLVSLFKNGDGISRAAGTGCLVYLLCSLFTINTPAVSPLFWVLLYGAGTPRKDAEVTGGDERARA